MSHVAIRRCVLRIRRHGGWSWGPDPDALLAAATRALPQLIAVRAARVVRAGSSDVRISSPIRIDIATTLDELARLVSAMRAGRDLDLVSGELSARLELELARALAPAIVDGSSQPTAGHDAPRIDEPTPAVDVDRERTATVRIVELLARWSREQRIVELIAEMPHQIVAAWLATIREATASTGSTAATPPALRELARMVVAELRHDLDPTQVALITLGAMAAGSGASPDLPMLASLLEVVDARVTSAPANASRQPVQHAYGPADSIADATHPSGTRTSSTQAPGRVTAAVAGVTPFVSCALPFLATVSLVRSGWIEAMTAILVAAQAPDLVPVVASAVAYKLMAPPLRGWSRTEEQRAAATVLAGREVLDQELADACSRLAPLATALIAPLATELRRGHRPGAPLVLAHDGERFALFDTEGMFLIATARELQPVLEAARGLGDPILVPCALATARTLDRIECANAIFVTDGPPERGQPWRAVLGARLWTNDGGALERWAALAEPLADAQQLADEVLAGLGARPALPRASDDTLDRIATHAAALALGDLAWTLFRDREQTTPALALERFATLDATIACDAERIEVRIPLGRRHADLLAHGYLRDVPWLDNRVIRLQGG